MGYIAFYMSRSDLHSFTSVMIFKATRKPLTSRAKKLCLNFGTCSSFDSAATDCC